MTEHRSHPGDVSIDIFSYVAVNDPDKWHQGSLITAPTEEDLDFIMRPVQEWTDHIEYAEPHEEWPSNPLPDDVEDPWYVPPRCQPREPKPVRPVGRQRKNKHSFPQGEECKNPDLAPATNFQRGCRCDRCMEWYREMYAAKKAAKESARNARARIRDAIVERRLERLATWPQDD